MGTDHAANALSLAAFIISLLTFIFNALWTPFQKARTDQIKLSLDLKRYYTQEMQQHLDTLYRKRGYLDYLQNWTPEAVTVDKSQLDHARRVLGVYWDELFEFYDSGALPTGSCSYIPAWMPRGPFWSPRDMMSGKFARKAKEYMVLAEPVDCANWYAKDIDKEDQGDGKPKGIYSPDNRFRPGRYRRLESLLSAEEKEKLHAKFLRIADLNGRVLPTGTAVGAGDMQLAGSADDCDGIA